MSESAVIEFRLTRKRRRWYFVAAVLLIIVVVYDASQLQDDNTEAGTLTAITLCGTALGAILIWRQSRRGSGKVQVDAHGLLVDTTMALGRVNWDNLEKIGVFKRLWSPFLGIALKDPNAFLESRPGLKGQFSLDMNLLNIGNAASLSTVKGAELFSKMFPYPQLGMNLEMLAANRNNFGFDLCLSLAGVDGAQGILARIESWRPAVVAKSEAETPVTGDFKICPQCAEQVRAAAKICRFCHYSFETAAAKV